MGKKVCIFCASSTRIAEKYTEATRELASLLAANGWDVVYGGGSVGLMGTVADTMLSAGGDIIGVIPTFMVEVEWDHKDVKDMRKTDTMAERKALMMDLSDAIVALPGGTGTLDEFFEAMSDKKLGLRNKPLVLLNTDGFYDHTIAQLERMVADGFISESHKDVLSVAATPAEVIRLIEQPTKSIELKDAQI